MGILPASHAGLLREKGETLSHVYRCDKCGNEYDKADNLVTVTHSQPNGGGMLDRHFCAEKCYVPPTGPATDEPAESDES